MLRSLLIGFFSCLAGVGLPLTPSAHGFCGMAPVIAPNPDVWPPWSFQPSCKGNCEWAGGGDCKHHTVQEGMIFDTVTCTCDGTKPIVCHLEVEVNPSGWVVNGEAKCKGVCLFHGSQCELQGAFPANPLGPGSQFPKCDCGPF
jgi:hypothetical protein